MDLALLFPDADYGFHMRLKRGEPRDYFAPTAEHERIIAERCDWLTATPETYSAWLPDGEPLLDEAIQALHGWGNISDGDHASLLRMAGRERLLALGKMLEPDFLLLRPGVTGEVELVAGCVCFPSSWNLAEKIGRPITFIHDAVPGLNRQIGGSIRTFLGRVAPGAAWLRENWGLTRSAELNQHPARKLPRLDASVEPVDVWLRVEHQALVALPNSAGVLFGIRITQHSLREVQRDPAAAGGLVRALQTMPAEVADYKGITAARQRIIELLSGT